ncbi:MAG: hypothetical protein AAGA00_13210 [Pseudomonadota bacterium]
MTAQRLRIGYIDAMHLIPKAIAASLFLCFMSLSVNAASLVMFDRKGCPWCAKWHAEIGADVYNAGPEGRRAPLRVLDVDTPRPQHLHGIGGIVGTPTFVLVENGREIDRMVGYPGKQVFFGKVQLMLDKLTGADKQYKTIIVQ